MTCSRSSVVAGASTRKVWNSGESASFRDLDYHFVSPVVFLEGQNVVLSVACENEGSTACESSAYFSGFQNSGAAVAQATPEPAPTAGRSATGGLARADAAAEDPDLTVDDRVTDEPLLPGLGDQGGAADGGDAGDDADADASEAASEAS